MSTMNTTTVSTETGAVSTLHTNESCSTCPLCCAEDNLSVSSTVGTILSTCQHRSCRACLVKWIEREEATGQTTLPTCPFCRSNISDEDVLGILGRSFKPREVRAGGPNNGDVEIDELTLQWINEHTVPCGGCGSYIEKADGCDLIECLCGYRFCYNCGVAGGECDCNPGHDFLDDDDEYIADAPIRDMHGRVDFRSCIIRREVRRDREYEREENMYEQMERWYCSSTNALLCTCNGIWLFSSTTYTGSISMLAHQLCTLRMEACRKRECQREENINEQLGRWDYSAINAAVCTSNGRWLFSSKKYNRCILMLAQQLRQEDISFRRCYDPYAW